MSVFVYLALVVLTNVVFQRFGVIPVGFGLMAPAAVLVVGFVLIARDVAHRRHGWKPIVAAILVGTAISAVMSPQLAVASGAAFLFAELADLAVYSKLRARGFTLAVVSSNIVGAVIDSLLFLWLAFGSFGFLAGQLVGKLWATVLFLVVAGIAALEERSYRRRMAASAE